jgi:hypothetical protein
MWRCAYCGRTLPEGTFCPACGGPIDEALSEISRKVRKVRLRRGIAARWGWRGAVTGFIASSALSLILAGFLVVRHLVAPRGQATMGDVFAVILSVFVSALLMLPLMFAAVFQVFGYLLKPICVALFCSVERFEQEYGPAKKHEPEA